MPYKKRGLQMLRDWEPDDEFDPEEDRLLITTSWYHTLVIRIKPEGDDALGFILDPEFLPENLLSVRSMLDFAMRTPHWPEYMAEHPWYIFIYDGDMTSSGPGVDLVAVGAGWQRKVDTSWTLTSITPVRKSEIDRSALATTVDGVYFRDLKLSSTLPR